MILILGSKGMLGGQLMKVFGNEAIGWDKEDADILDFENLKSKILNLKSKPEVLINCVAYNDVDKAEDNETLVFKLNAEAVKNISAICKEQGITLVHFSSNYVFDGKIGEYVEMDMPNPQSIYAQAKYKGEQAVVEICKNFYLIRTAVLFGPKGQSELSKKSFIELILESANENNSVKAIEDEINSITYAKDLAQEVKRLIDDKKPFGVYHIINSGQASWYDYAKEIFYILGKEIVLESISSGEFKRKAVRPKKSILINTKLPPMRPWQEALREFLISN